MTSETVYKTHKQPIAQTLSKPAVKLIVAGGVLLTLTLAGVSILSMIAPLLFIGGAGFILMLPSNRSSEGNLSNWSFLAGPGAFLIALGSIIFVLNLVNHFEAFSYLWTLLLIAFVGGLMHARRYEPSHPIHTNGSRIIRVLTIVGITMAVIFELFVFETFGPWWPLILIGYGFYLLFTRRKASADETV